MAWPRWLDPRTRRRLGAALLAALALPWLVGAWVKTGLQPGLIDDAQRSALRVDFIVIGATLCAVSAVMTWACGCWIVAVMKGPHRRGDPFPSDR